MSDLRKAAEQALEALEIVYGEGKRCEAAIKELRQALAQPDLAKVGEVGVWGHKREWVGLTEKEIIEIIEVDDNVESIGEFALAIEAKLKEKNA